MKNTLSLFVIYMLRCLDLWNSSIFLKALLPIFLMLYNLYCVMFHKYHQYKNMHKYQNCVCLHFYSSQLNLILRTWSKTIITSFIFICHYHVFSLSPKYILRAITDFLSHFISQFGTKLSPFKEKQSKCNKQIQNLCIFQSAAKLKFYIKTQNNNNLTYI